jgi:hypothetical protein
MTTQNIEASQREHEIVMELLPWYSEGTLNPAETDMTENHLENCSVCREALTQYRSLGAAFTLRGESDAWQPSEAHFERLLAMVEQAEQAEARAKQPPKKARNWLASLDTVRAWFTEPMAPRWVLGAETLALAALVVALVIPNVPQRSIEGPAFETLTSPAKPMATTCEACLHVVFDGAATESEMRGLLQAIQGQVVEGPSYIGVYTVRLDSGEGGTLDEALKTLRANPKVRLAEPVSPAGR